MEFQMLDTQQIQVDSLIAYMASIGYTFDGKSWVNESKAMNHISRIGHRTAIALHNLPADQWQLMPNKMYAPVIAGRVFDFALNGYNLSRTQATKLVKKVKMQPDRKEPNGIILQSHMVKPFQPYMTVTLGLTE